MRKRPKKPCKHFSEYGWSRLYERYAWWCSFDPCTTDICMEDWRKKNVECENYKPDKNCNEFETIH